VAFSHFPLSTYSDLVRVHLQNIEDHIVKGLIVVIGWIIAVAGRVNLAWTQTGLAARVPAQVRELVAAAVAARCSGGWLVVVRRGVRLVIGLTAEGHQGYGGQVRGGGGVAGLLNVDEAH